MNLSSKNSTKDSEKRMWQSKLSGLILKVKGQLDLSCLYKTSVSLGLLFLASIMIST